MNKDKPTINSQVVLVGKTDRGMVYIKQTAPDQFELRTGKRFLATVPSIKASEEWLVANGFRLKRMGKTPITKPVDPALAEMSKLSKELMQNA